MKLARLNGLKGFGYGLLLFVILGFGSAQAASKSKHYIVTIKSPQAFKTISQQVKQQNLLGKFQQGASNSQANFHPFLQSLSNQNTKVEKVFNNLEMMVVSSDEVSKLKALAATDEIAIEEDIFLPLPAPAQVLATRKAYDNSPYNSTGVLELPWGLRAVKAPGAWALWKQGARGKSSCY